MKPVNLKEIILIVYIPLLILKQKTCQKQELSHFQLDATAKKVEIDMGSLESAENRLKSVLADFERQGNRMKNGSYVDKKVSMYSILCAVFSLLFACLMCYLWVDAAKDRDNYKRYYEYFQEMDKQKSGE